MKKFVSKKKNAIFAVQFKSGFRVADDIEQCAERYKDILDSVLLYSCFRNVRNFKEITRISATIIVDLLICYFG